MQHSRGFVFKEHWSLKNTVLQRQWFTCKSMFQVFSTDNGFTKKCPTQTKPLHCKCEQMYGCTVWPSDNYRWLRPQEEFLENVPNLFGISHSAIKLRLKTLKNSCNFPLLQGLFWDNWNQLYKGELLFSSVEQVTQIHGHWLCL